MPIKIASVKEAFADDANRTIKALIAGPPGSGKTRTASTWPNVIYADAEGRLLSVRDRNVLFSRIESISDLEEMKTMLDQDPDVRTQLFGRPVDTVVIDTVDEVARLIIKERLRNEKIEQMRMQDWGHLADTLRHILRGFRNLPDINVLLLCHLKSQEDSETGRTYFKPAIQGSVGDEIAGYVDEAFLLVARTVLDQQTGQRKIVRHFQTGPDPQHDWVKDHSGSMPLEFPIDFNTDYERMAKLIFGEKPVSDDAPIGSSYDVTVTDDKKGRPAGVAPPPVGVRAKKVPTEPPLRRKGPGKAATKPPVEDVPLPEPEPEPDLPPAATAAPDDVADDAENLPVAEDEATPAETPAAVSVPESGTETVDDDPLADLGNEPEAGPRCNECGEVVEPPDYAEFAEVRYGVPLCRKHFTARAKRR